MGVITLLIIMLIMTNGWAVGFGGLWSGGEGRGGRSRVTYRNSLGDPRKQKVLLINLLFLNKKKAFTLNDV